MLWHQSWQNNQNNHKYKLLFSELSMKNICSEKGSLKGGQKTVTVELTKL